MHTILKLLIVISAFFAGMMLGKKVNTLYSFELAEELIEYYYHSQDVIKTAKDINLKSDAACDMYACQAKIDSLLQ